MFIRWELEWRERQERKEGKQRKWRKEENWRGPLIVYKMRMRRNCGKDVSAEKLHKETFLPPYNLQ